MNNTRPAEIALSASDKRLRRDLARSKRHVQQFARDVGGSMSGGFKSAFGQIGALGTIGGLAAVGSQVLDVNRTLTRLGIQAGVSQSSITALHKRMLDLSDATGVSTAELAAGASEIVTLTGDYKFATDKLALFATVSNATGAAMRDVAGTAAALKQNLSIDSNDLEEAFNIMLVQGKAGSVELSDLASLLAGIAPQFASLNSEMNQGPKALAELGAALQVAKQGFGTSAEAVTGLQALFKALTSKAAKFKGVQIFQKDPKTGVKRMRAFSDIIRDISESRLAKDPTKLAKAFGSVEALRTFTQLSEKYGEFQKLQRNAMGKNALREDDVRYSESAAGRIEVAWERMQNAVAREFTADRVELLASAAIKLAEAVGFVVDNAGNLALALGAIKVAQFSATLLQLSGSMGVVGAASTGTATALTGATAALSGFLAKAGVLVGVGVAANRLATVALKAVGVLDEDGNWADDTKTKRSVYDPKGEVDSFRVRREQVQEDLRKLRHQEYGLEQVLARGAAGSRQYSPQRLEKRQAQLDEVRRKKAFAERELERYTGRQLATQARVLGEINDTENVADADAALNRLFGDEGKQARSRLREAASNFDVSGFLSGLGEAASIALDTHTSLTKAAPLTAETQLTLGVLKEMHNELRRMRQMGERGQPGSNGSTPTPSQPLSQGRSPAP